MKYALGNMLNGAGGLNPDGIALDLQFAADKTLTARRGPTPTFSRSSSGTFVNANGLIVGKTEGTTSSITPSTQTIGSQVTVTVASGSVVGWVIGQAISLIVDTDGQDDPDATELWLLGNIVSTTATTLIFEVTSKTAQAGSATSWTLGYRGPRFDHNPVSPFACRGLLIEEGRTNLLNGSQTFATSGGSQNNWVDTNITRDGTLRTSPDGTANALRITASAANGTVISSAAAGSSAARVFSIFLRRVTGTGDIQYTLDNGSTWTTQSITGSWVRYTFAATTANQQVGIRIVTSGDAIEIWGAQLEAGSFATSYIPTTTSTLARSADVCSITGDNFTRFYNQPEGTLFASGIVDTVGVGLLFPFFLSLNDGTANNRILLGSTNSGGAAVRPIIANSGSNIYMQSIGTVSAGQSRKVALAYQASDFMAAANSQLATAGTTGSPPSGLNRADINSNFFVGTIAAIRYYKKRLPNAKIQALTA